MQVAELFAKLGLNVDKKSWSVGNDVIAGLGKALAVFVGYKVVAGIGNMVTEVIELGGHLNDLAQSTGQNVETLQELGYVAKLNSSSTEELGATLGKLSRNMYAAAHGSKEQAKAFGELGIKVTESNGTLRASEDVLLDLADRFSTMPDGPQKTAEAMSVLGKSGAALIPTLNNGRAGIEKLRQEFKDLGGEIKSGDISELDDLGDNLDRMKTAWQGIKNQVVVALVPVLKEMITGLLEWVKANRELIADKLKSFIEALAFALRVLGTTVAFIVDHWQLFVAALVGIGLVTGLVRLIKLFEWLQLASTAAAAKTLWAWTLAAAPFVILAAAIGAFVYAILKYRTQARAVFNWLAGHLVNFLSWITSLPGKAIGALVSLGTMIKDKIGEALDWVKTKAGELWDYIKSLPGKAAGAFFGSVLPGDLGGTGGGASAPSGGPVQGFRTLNGTGTVQKPRGNNSVSITNGPISVVTQPGADNEAIAKQTRDIVQEHWNTELNHMFADSGEDE